MTKQRKEGKRKQKEGCKGDGNGVGHARTRRTK